MICINLAPQFSHEELTLSVKMPSQSVSSNMSQASSKLAREYLQILREFTLGLWGGSPTEKRTERPKWPAVASLCSLRTGCILIIWYCYTGGCIRHKTSKALQAYIIILHYTKIIVVRLCVCPSVTGGHRKRFDPEKQEAVSLAIEQQKLELGNLCDHHPWH